MYLMRNLEVRNQMYLVKAFYHALANQGKFVPSFCLFEKNLTNDHGRMITNPPMLA